MDRFIIIIDLLVILFYILLIAVLSPYMMRFIKKRNGDVFFQLMPVLSLILISSITISMGYGGFSETLFFRLTSILSFILLLCLLFLTLLMKKVWPERYEHLISKLSLSKLKEISLSKVKRQ